MIPKQIFQTWKTHTLPKPIQDCVNKMLQLNPTYSYKLFDDNEMKEYIATNFDEKINLAYSKLNVGAARADLWRYLILYKEGGIYLDIDSVLYSSLDTLIKTDDTAIISRERNPDIFLQWCMIFQAGHPILKLTIEKCVYNILNETTCDILYLTGPRVFSESITNLINTFAVGFSRPYYINDSILNEKLKGFCRFYDYDFPGYCNWKHENAELLYSNVLHWSKDEIKFT